MLFQTNSSRRDASFIPKSAQSKKLTWKDKFKRDLFQQNLKFLETVKSSQNKMKKDVRYAQQKRAAAKCMSKLFERENIYVEDNQLQYEHHGHYSAYVPLKNQSKLNDQLKNTFPYVQHLVEKGHQQSKANVYNQISNFMRDCAQKNMVENGWKSCLKKYMCSLDVLKAIEIYVQLLKKGTSVLSELHKKYGDGCSKQVFFHRVCLSAKYFKESTKINKNVKTSMQYNDQINEVSLPKTSKYLFCSICLLYDCNQHNADESATEFDFQYVAKDNIISEETNIKHALNIIRFQKNMEIFKENLQRDTILIEKFPPMDQEGQLQCLPNLCSTECYKGLTKETYTKKYNVRRTIISLTHRAMIKLGIDIYSYDPCVIAIWVGNQMKNTTAKGINRNITCESIYFYLVEQFGIGRRLQYKLHNSEEEYLLAQKAASPFINDFNEQGDKVYNTKKKRKPKLQFDHENIENYRVGCCFHYYKGGNVIDTTCQKCCCKSRGFCLPQCQCTDQCTIRKVGCQCKGEKIQCRTKKCPCFESKQDCIPGVCVGCFNTDEKQNKKNQCKNSMVLKNETKHIKIGDSNICGLGAFAGEDINKDDLVVIYTGEMIEHQIDFLREGLRFDSTFYNFGLHEGGAIDARFIGNKSRFINHQKGGEQNLQAFSVFGEGKYRTVMFAKRNIKKGEQLYFDYDVDNNISTNFPGKYDFIKKVKK